MRNRTSPMALMAVALVACTADVATAPSAARPALDRARPFPDVIALPDGFWPEGIDFGRGTTFYVGSIASGAVFRGDARTGEGYLLVPAQPGRENAGVRYDARGDRLFVAGGTTGEAYVYDAATGESLATYRLADPSVGATLVNDVVVLRDAVYITDSYRDVLYRIPLGEGGALAGQDAVQSIPLTGDFVSIPDAFAGNANGIAATPGGKRVIVVNTTTGRLYLVDPQTGVTAEIDLGGGSVPGGDGILLVGRTLYVVQGDANRIAVVHLDAHFTRGTIERVIDDADLAFPSTVARLGTSLYAVNARFDVTPGPDVAYQVVRMTR